MITVMVWPLYMVAFAVPPDIMDVMKRLLLVSLRSWPPAVRGRSGRACTRYTCCRWRSGLDQYLANRLTNEHVFQVVTDPKLGRRRLHRPIGEGFEQKMDELSPPPEPPEAEATKDEKKTRSRSVRRGEGHDQSRPMRVAMSVRRMNR